MEEKELNFVDRFLYKFFIGLILLLGLVLLNKFELVSYDLVKSKLQEHFNVIEVIKKINGKTNLIPIDFSKDNVVSKTYYNDYEKLEDGYKIKLGDYEAVECYKSGIVVSVNKNKDKTYNILIKGNDGLEYSYEKLTQIDVRIYQYLDSGKILGKAYNENENYFIFKVYKNKELYFVLDED